MSTRTTAYAAIQASYLWKEGDFLSQWKSDPKYVSFSLKHRCLQYRHSDAPSEPPYKTVSLFYASAVRELPLAHDNVLDCLTPAQGLSRPSEMLSGSDMRLPPFAFEIVNPFRTHVFRAPSAEACRAWCDALRHMFSEQCFRRPFKVLHAGKLLLRTGGALSFFRSWEVRSVLLCPRFLLVFDSQAIGEAFVERASQDESAFVEAALQTSGVKMVLIEGSICAELGEEVDGQQNVFVVSCARVDGNTSKIGEQFEFAARSEHHLTVWMEAILAEIAAPAQQEKDYKKALKHAHKSGSKAHKEHKEKKKEKRRTGSVESDAGDAAATALATASRPAAATAAAEHEPPPAKPKLSRANTFRDSIDPSVLPSFGAASASSSSSAAESVSFGTAAQNLSAHLQQRQQPPPVAAAASATSPSVAAAAPIDREAEIARRQQKRLHALAQEELIRKRAEAEREELVEILGATIGEWKARHAHDIRRMINSLHEVFDVREGQYAIAADALAPAVRRVYNRLLLIIHPDRTVNDTIEKQICATVLFAEMRSAFEAFEAWCAAQEDDDD